MRQERLRKKSNLCAEETLELVGMAGPYSLLDGEGPRRFACLLSTSVTSTDDNTLPTEPSTEETPSPIPTALGSTTGPSTHTKTLYVPSESHTTSLPHILISRTKPKNARDPVKLALGLSSDNTFSFQVSTSSLTLPRSRPSAAVTHLTFDHGNSFCADYNSFNLDDNRLLLHPRKASRCF